MPSLVHCPLKQDSLSLSAKESVPQEEEAGRQWQDNDPLGKHPWLDHCSIIAPQRKLQSSSHYGSTRHTPVCTGWGTRDWRERLCRRKVEAGRQEEMWLPWWIDLQGRGKALGERIERQARIWCSTGDCHHWHPSLLLALDSLFWLLATLST
jgi:hypothetical protein